MSVYQQNVFLESDDEDNSSSNGSDSNTITFQDEREADAWLRAKGFKK